MLLLKNTKEMRYPLTLMCNNLWKVYSESDSDLVEAWLSLLPLSRNKLKSSHIEKELINLIIESINSKSEDTFCR